MLTRVHIRGFKSLPDVEVHLPRLAVLIGSNAAGKSNFLDALQLLSKLATSQNPHEAFEPPYRGTALESFTFGPDGTQGLLQQETLSLALEVNLHLSDPTIAAVTQEIKDLSHPNDRPLNGENASSAIQTRTLRYRLAIELYPGTGLLNVADEYLAILDAQREPIDPPIIGPQGLKVLLHREDQTRPMAYDSHRNRSILSMPHYPPHYPHLTAVRHELERWQFFYFEPRERMRAAYPVIETHRIGPRGERLAPYLNTVRALDPNQFEGIEVALRALLPHVTGIDLDVNKDGDVELYLLEEGTPVPARLLSEGTLRLLGLLSLSGVKEIPALVGLEEPENGVHPRRIELLAELLRTHEFLKQSQYIVTTHSPILPNWLNNDVLFIVHRLNGSTRIDPFSAWDPLRRDHRLEKDSLPDMEPVMISERILRGNFYA